ATTANLKGGLGSASAVTAEGCIVGALAAVNAVGRATVADTPHFWAAPFEIGTEFGGHGPAPRLAPEALELPLKGSRPRQATTLVVVATDADISQVALKRIAIMANAGLARAIYPAHSPLDGDIVLALATGQRKCAEAPDTLARLGQAAINVVARAVARGVYEARTPEGAPAGPPAYKELFGET
ncbi:MAG: peptidase T4, partial [Alphaproteobacteria bacterium]